MATREHRILKDIIHFFSKVVKVHVLVILFKIFAGVLPINTGFALFLYKQKHGLTFIYLWMSLRHIQRCYAV